MRVYESVIPANVESRIDIVALRIHMSNNDSPARAKITGTPGHRSNEALCICLASHEEINLERGYDIERAYKP